MIDCEVFKSKFRAGDRIIAKCFQDNPKGIIKRHFEWLDDVSSRYVVTIPSLDNEYQGGHDFYLSDYDMVLDRRYN